MITTPSDCIQGLRMLSNHYFNVQIVNYVYKIRPPLVFTVRPLHARTEVQAQAMRPVSPSLAAYTPPGTSKKQIENQVAFAKYTYTHALQAPHVLKMCFMNITTLTIARYDPVIYT